MHAHTLVRIALALPVAAAPAIAAAGYAYTSEVTIYAHGGGQSVWGNARDIRASNDTVQYLACYVQSDARSTQGVCSATDLTGTSAMCTTTQPELINNIRSIGTTSSIAFSTRHGASACESITVYNGSL